MFNVEKRSQLQAGAVFCAKAHRSVKLIRALVNSDALQFFALKTKGFDPLAPVRL